MGWAIFWENYLKLSLSSHNLYIRRIIWYSFAILKLFFLISNKVPCHKSPLAWLIYTNMLSSKLLSPPFLLKIIHSYLAYQNLSKAESE